MNTNPPDPLGRAPLRRDRLPSLRLVVPPALRPVRGNAGAPVDNQRGLAELVPGQRAIFDLAAAAPGGDYAADGALQGVGGADGLALHLGVRLGHGVDRPADAGGL